MKTTDLNPPDETLARVEIVATLDLKTKVWTVSCKQWNSSFPAKCLTRAVAMLAAEIENHNEGGEAVPPYSSNKPLGGPFAEKVCEACLHSKESHDDDGCHHGEGNGNRCACRKSG